MSVHSRYKDLTLKQLKFFKKFSKSVALSYKKTVARTSDTSMSSFRNVKSILYQRYTMMPKILRNTEPLKLEIMGRNAGRNFVKIRRRKGYCHFLYRELIESAFAVYNFSGGTFKSSPNSFLSSLHRFRSY